MQKSFRLQFSFDRVGGMSLFHKNAPHEETEQEQLMTLEDDVLTARDVLCELTGIIQRYAPQPRTDDPLSTIAVVNHTRSLMFPLRDMVTFLEVLYHYHQTGTYPTSQDNLISVSGVDIGQWCDRQYGQNTPSLWTHLLDDIPNTVDFVWDDDLTMVMVLAFVAHYGHLPAYDHQGYSPNGSSLYDFIHRDNPRTLPEWGYRWLDSYGFFDETPYPTYVQQVYDFCHTHGRFPSVRDRDMTLDGCYILSEWVVQLLNGRCDDQLGGRKARLRIQECARDMTSSASRS